MISSSNAEALVRMVIVNSLALSLDAVLFSTGAGSSVAPPGLLYSCSRRMRPVPKHLSRRDRETKRPPQTS
jgi:hypothetical protein